MLKKLINTVNAHALLAKGQEVLVAVSGGVDSMVLLHALYKAGYKCTAAHVNFCLRGNESDKDEALVKEYTQKLNVPCLSISFDTTTFAKENKLSIEMAARQLRYDWFSKVCSEKGITAVAVGHHKDDQVETFFMNLVRGSGLKGLSGIRYKNNMLVRPLLDVNRTEILNYAKTENIPWREDESNKDDSFQRNKYRLSILPEIKQINPGLDETIIRTLKKMKEGNQIISRYVELWSGMYLKEEDNTIYIPILPLKESDGPSTVLHELISPYGYNESQIEDIIAQMEDASGKIFYAGNKRLIIDRFELILTNLEENSATFTIGEDLNTEHLPIKLQLSKRIPNTSEKIPSSKNKVWFDAAQLSFPLTLRKWDKGDTFRPFGMKGSKKLSDYFIDEKLSQLEKEQAWVLCSSERIIWLVGYRTDDRVKISSYTTVIIEAILKS